MAAGAVCALIEPQKIVVIGATGDSTRTELRWKTGCIRRRGSLSPLERHRTPSRSHVFHRDDANAAMSELLKNVAARS